MPIKRGNTRPTAAKVGYEAQPLQYLKAQARQNTIGQGADNGAFSALVALGNGVV